jgi:uncharacterized protein (TIGR02145 family)
MKIFVVIFILLLFLCPGCKKPKLPSVDTVQVTNISLTTAICKGNIDSDGDSPITQKGFCWSHYVLPTIGNGTETEDLGKGDGDFTCSLSNLDPGTSYYVRAFATNIAGTAYGNAVLFTTNFSSSENINDIDTNTYHVLHIGYQTWMAENLRTTRYKNGDNIPNVTDSLQWETLTSGAFCNYFKTMNSDTITAYGRLYNYYAVTDIHMVCPNGWHVPYANEWKALFAFVGVIHLGCFDGAGKLKEQGTVHWNSPNLKVDNSSRFTALPGGERYFGEFRGMGSKACYWSATDHFSGDANYFKLVSDDIINDNDLMTKTTGLSIRCIKN